MDQQADTVVAALLISPEPDGRRSNVQATLKNDGRAKALGVAIASRSAVADVVPIPGIDIIPLQASDCFADLSSAYSVCLTRTGFAYVFKQQDQHCTNGIGQIL